jgi:protein-L-isoaspartate O-methyltransferase|tara:strand:+ start:1436 stop:1669 length:234 start_codon:yes stop_codon:yes gene_type:complete
MAIKKQQQYARISTYGDLLVPMSMLEQLVQEGMLVRTSYEGDVDQITEIKKIDNVKIHSEDELENARVQMALQGTEK